ncbi:CBS domain-containing protein [Sulfuriflexus sp.]|uniref:CBS domain-containing protein n=1 Tax=Sulfuriflexus sp. TaxID=2015443 RepID=UPI0028CF8C4A|nr:CBS domain-containing protein [Sulfuriflexus sp.]MDT8404745.1 CBS domain-containing protein [Sulfuriflexus sp.]
MLIDEIMNTEMKVAMSDSSVHEAALSMYCNQINSMPVVDTNDRLVGMISEENILFAMYPGVNDFVAYERFDFEVIEKGYTRVLNQQVAGLMHEPGLCLPPAMPVLQAVSLMYLNNIRKVLITEEEKLVGIFTTGDVHRALFETGLATRPFKRDKDTERLSGWRGRHTH